MNTWVMNERIAHSPLLGGAGRSQELRFHPCPATPKRGDLRFRPSYSRGCTATKQAPIRLGDTQDPGMEARKPLETPLAITKSQILLKWRRRLRAGGGLGEHVGWTEQCRGHRIPQPRRDKPNSGAVRMTKPVVRRVSTCPFPYHPGQANA